MRLLLEDIKGFGDHPDLLLLTFQYQTSNKEANRQGTITVTVTVTYHRLLD
jgi:hypothetical protein